jgi:uncharacterized DUF497 family protein
MDRRRLMATEIAGEFEWDVGKSRANVRKHGVTFMEAARAFLDPFAVDLPDLAHPERMVLLGMSMPERLLYVVYTERVSSGRLRIISARRATRHEQKNYEEQ